MKLYVIVNALSGKVNKPFVVESDAEAREFCLSMVLSDQTNSLLNLSKFYFCHHLADFDVPLDLFHNNTIGDPSDCNFSSEKFGCIDFNPSVDESCTFCVYDVVSPYIDMVIANSKKKSEVLNEENNT